MMKSDALPPSLHELLRAIGGRLENGESIEAELPSALAGISSLSAATISQTAPAIANAAKLYRWRPEPSWSRKLLRPYLTDKEQLLRVPGLQFLFLFHLDGRIREAALQRVTGGLQTPFLFAAVSIRLNDWVEPVRTAAVACAKRCFPLTSADVIANAATALVLRQESWGRWGGEREALDATLARPDVAKEFANVLCDAKTGPASRILRLVLKNSAIDPHLAHLAVNARQPSVRAMAVQMIADMRASWPTGWEWQWMDKSMGQGRWVPKIDFRDIQVALDKEWVVRNAASDTSAVVRRAALTALIQHRLGKSEAEELALMLRDDPNPSVRERAMFILSRAPGPSDPSNAAETGPSS